MQRNNLNIVTVNKVLSLQTTDFPVFFPLLVYCTEKSYLTVTCKVLDIYQIDLRSFTSFRFVSFRFREIQQAYSNYYFSCPPTQLVAIDILPIIRSFFFLIFFLFQLVPQS